MIILGCVQWNLVNGWKDFRLKLGSNPGPLNVEKPSKFNLCQILIMYLSKTPLYLNSQLSFRSNIFFQFKYNLLRIIVI